MANNDQILDEDFRDNRNQTILDRQTIQQINAVKVRLNDDIKNIKNARVALIVLGGLAAAVALFSIVSDYLAEEFIIEGIFTSIVYFSCAIGVIYNPRVSIIVGISYYVLIWLLSITVDPSHIYQGIIWKFVAIYFLSKGIEGASGLKKKTNELFKLGAPSEEIDKAKSLAFLVPTKLPAN